MSNGIKKGRCLLTKEEIISLYNSGQSTSLIAKEANVSDRYIRMILQNANVEMRKRTWKRKYRVNEDYFKTWTKNMAYVLGFFYADGFIATSTQTVSFSQKEKYILEMIRDELNSNHVIIKNIETGVHILNIHSKTMKEDLMNLFGISSNKSILAEFPRIPDKYLSHFVRGYFDGDGYVNYKSYFVSFVGGSIGFMKNLQSILESQGFETNFTSHTKHFRVYISGRRSINRFANWIYNQSEICLERKFNEFNKETLDISQLKDGIKTHKNALRKRRRIDERHKNTDTLMIELSMFTGLNPVQLCPYLLTQLYWIYRKLT